jgi:pimeloyl-ACP methyl ester carboxylesterase
MLRPLFFGTGRRRLFGVHQEPIAARARRHGVLLCYPGMHEYGALHWAFRKLAGMLVREGFDVFRFDWSGTGDSSGEAGDAALDDWVEEVALAADELRDASGAGRLTVLGMRLGAAIAARAVAKGLATSHLVLWDPVVSGRTYLAELDALDRHRNMRLLHPIRGEHHELLGYPFSPAARRETESIDLLAELPATARVGVFANIDRPGHAELAARARALGAAVVRQVVSEAAGTAQVSAGDAAVLPSKILAAMTAHVVEGAS